MDPEDDEARPAPDQPYALSRVGSVIQILSAAVGLGTYVALAGGIAEWVRLTVAGLPASHALSAYEPVSLLASGFQTLLIVPVVLLGVYVLIIAAREIKLSPTEHPAVPWVRRGWWILTQCVILLAA